MNFFYAFILSLALFPALAFASEELDPALEVNDSLSSLENQLNQGPNTSAPSSQKFMDEEDMDFNDGKDSSAIPMIQKSNPNSVAPAPQPREMAGPAQFVEPEAPEGKNIRKGATLTDTLQAQDKEKLPNIPLPDVSGTWVDKLAGSVSLPHPGLGTPAAGGENMPQVGTPDENLRSLVDDTRGTGQRSNASVFDISGVMLRMTMVQAEKAMMIRGYKKISQQYDIPNFIRWRNEETCRNNGTIGYERVENCVVEIAKKNNHQYVALAKFSKFSTKEDIEIRLTSNFTNNKIFYISYKTGSGKVIGSGSKAAYLRNIKVFDFWKKVNQKYGNPDNKEDITWGLGTNKPYLRASTGYLLLEDPMLRELDYTRMSREDQRFMKTDLYSF